MAKVGLAIEPVAEARLAIGSVIGSILDCHRLGGQTSNWTGNRTGTDLATELAIRSVAGLAVRFVAELVIGLAPTW